MWKWAFQFARYIIYISAGVRLVGLPADFDRVSESLPWWQDAWQWIVTSDIAPWVGLGVLLLLTVLLDLWPALTKWYCQWRGLPMTIATRKHLTFGEIVDRWTKEMKGHPGEISRDEILQELLAGVWSGYFEDKHGKSCLILISNTDHNDREQNHGEWSRRLLLAALYPRIQNGLDDTPLPPRIGDELTPDSDIPWAEIGKLRLNIYEDLDRSTYIEPLLVSKSDFKRWAQKAHRTPPKFWFG